MTALDRVEIESTIIIWTSPLWFAAVVVWAGWCELNDWWRARG